MDTPVFESASFELDLTLAKLVESLHMLLADLLNDYSKQITKALLRVYDVAKETPLTYASPLSNKLGNNIYLKREDMQPVFSFKLRGAYNFIASLSQEALQKGVITSSAGNHAQGVALAAKRLGIPAVIVMPRTTPGIKVRAVEALGGKIILHGDVYDDAYAKAIELRDSEGMTYVHPFDAPDVIAGQGTIAFEIMKQCKTRPDAIFIPVGGGGLAAGVAAFIKMHSPTTRIVAVEATDSACLKASLDAKERIKLPQVGIFADGTAVKLIGEETFKILSQTVDDMITVTPDEICAAIKDVFENTRTLVEPAGALAVAGIKKYVREKQIKDQLLVGINSGANVNFDRLRYISERAEMGEEKEIMFAATIPEAPGSYKQFCQLIGARNVTEFNYRYNDPKTACIFVGLELPGGALEKAPLFETLRAHGYTLYDLTDNEVAQLHVKHMVGGKTSHAQNERLFRVEFPERPGAIMDFLTKMNPAWNISLFHYRNYGSSFGRVLIGIQVPPQDVEAFSKFQEEIGYSFIEETNNPAYKLFL